MTAYNHADEPDGRTDAVCRYCLARLKSFWPAGYPQTLATHGNCGGIKEG